MSDIKLFHYANNGARELAGKSAAVERTLQRLIESQMDTFLGVRFLSTEYSTGAKYRGRIDSLGLDENGCPVIVEYKRHSNENVINQGLFYLDWLLDHKADFQLLVMKQLGKDEADRIEWGGTRLLCIAADFTRYDEHAVAQINRNIELIRYKLFGEDLLLLELVNGASATSTPSASELDKPLVERPARTPAASTLATATSSCGRRSPSTPSSRGRWRWSRPRWRSASLGESQIARCCGCHLTTGLRSRSAIGESYGCRCETTESHRWTACRRGGRRPCSVAWRGGPTDSTTGRTSVSGSPVLCRRSMPSRSLDHWRVAPGRLGSGRATCWRWAERKPLALR